MNRKGLLFAALLMLMVLANAGLGPLLSPLLYTMTPLQRQYLGAYIASSFKVDDPEATTKIQWVLKLKPRKTEGKPEPKARHKGRTETATETGPELGFARERDVVAKPVASTLWAGRALPFTLSAEAEREGWTGLDWSVAQQAESGKLRDVLCADYFNGERWWSFFMPPVMALLSLFVLVMLTRAWLKGRRERHLWGPPRSRYEPLWRWMFEPPQPTWETREQQRRIEPSRPTPRQLEASALPQPATRNAEAPAPAMPQREAVVVERNPRPAQAAARPQKAAYTWDESQGIE